MSSAGRAMADGERPKAGGWNRIHLVVDDVEPEVARLWEDGVTFRNDIARGPGGAVLTGGIVDRADGPRSRRADRALTGSFGMVPQPGDLEVQLVEYD